MPSAITFMLILVNNLSGRKTILYTKNIVFLMTCVFFLYPLCNDDVCATYDP